MTTMYKLTTQQHTTHNGMKWEIGKKNVALVAGSTMCTAQVLHCYASPIQAVLLNPIHANISNPVMFEIDCSNIVNTDGLKYACKEQTPKRVVQLPIVSLNQKVAIAIKLALLVYKAAPFVKWATSWLDGSDRSADAAARAYDAAADAADAAHAAADAAHAAADAARAAAARAAAAHAAAAAARAAAARAADAAHAAYAYADSARAGLKDFAKSFSEIIDWVMENIT